MQVAFVTAWGDGFVTDGGIISQNGLSDPRPFFDTLSTKPYLDRVRPAYFIMQRAEPIPYMHTL
jgi:hypothetical protein